MTEKYLEDFEVGERVEFGSIAVDQAEIIRFAESYDPQPFHTDPQAAQKTFFGGLAASGWHTASMTMRLLVDAKIGFAWGMIGREVEKLEWPRPTRAGDVLRVRCEVLEVIPSKSRRPFGIVRVRTETVNQADEIVQRMVSAMVVPIRAAVALSAG